MATRETFEIEVCDLEVVRRTVALPLRCPKCGADFSDAEGDGLKVWEYQDQSRTAVVERASVDDATYFDWPGLPEAGESFVQVRVDCAACGAVLARGKEAERHDP